MFSLDKDSFCYIKPEALSQLCLDLRLNIKGGFVIGSDHGETKLLSMKPVKFEKL